MKRAKPKEPSIVSGSFYLCKQNRIYWTIIPISILSIAMLSVPLTTLVQIGSQISPTGSLLDKTILLFQILKVVLPLFGVLAIIWVSIPNLIRQTVALKLENIANSKWTLPAILVVGLLLRLGWVFYYPTQPYADSEWYFDLAHRLVSGQGYVYDLNSMKPTASWPVGYPAFLALLFAVVGPSIPTALLANVVLEVIIIYLTYRVAKRMFDNTVAVLSALFIMLLPGMIVYTSLVSTEILFTTLFLVVLNLSLSHPSHLTMSFFGAFVTGLINGAFVLTRATGLILFPLWISIRWISVRKTPNVFRTMMRWIFVYTLGTCMIVLPWTIRNYVYFHRFIPVSTNGGANFWIGNNPAANGGFMFPRDPGVNPLAPLIGDEIAVEDTGYRAGLQFIQEHPERLPKLLLAKIFYLYNSNDFGLAWNIRSAVSQEAQPITPLAYALTNVIYTMLAFLAIVGLIVLALCHVSDPMVWIGVMVSIYWSIIHLPYFGQDRFALPLLPFLTTYAAFGVAALLRFQSVGALQPTTG